MWEEGKPYLSSPGRKYTVVTLLLGAYTSVKRVDAKVHHFFTMFFFNSVRLLISLNMVNTLHYLFILQWFIFLQTYSPPPGEKTDKYAESQSAVAFQHLIRTDVCQLQLMCKIKAQILMKNTYVFIVIACIAFGACLHRYNIIIIYKIVIILIVNSLVFLNT